MEGSSTEAEVHRCCREAYSISAEAAQAFVQAALVARQDDPPALQQALARAGARLGKAQELLEQLHELAQPDQRKR